MGAPLWLFDYTAAVLVEAQLASLGSTSWFLHKQKETSRKSSWLIQFPRIPLLEGLRGSREVHEELTGKLNMTAPEEGMAQLKGGGLGWAGIHLRLLNSVIHVEIPHPPWPKSHHSTSWKHTRTPTGQYQYLLYRYSPLCLLLCGWGSSPYLSACSP